MGQSLDFSKIPPLSEAEIEQNAYKLKDLWMIHHNKKIYGPYHVKTVKEIADANQKELEPSSACKLSRGRWFFFYDNKEFQSRNDQEYYKPVVIANEMIKIYADEQEYGPYEFPELVHLLKEKKFRYVDLFSIDDGETWRKIYEIDGLDRRYIDENQLKLPDIPQMSAYTSEQLKFIKKTPNNHNVVLELKKIDPQIQQNSRKEKVKAAQQRRVRSELRSSSKTSSQEKSSSMIGLAIALILALVAWNMFKDDIMGMFGSSKKAKFSQSDFQQRTFKRKVSRFNLGLQPAQRAEPRIRVAIPESEMMANKQDTDFDQEVTDQVDQQELNEDKRSRKNDISQREFDIAKLDSLQASDFDYEPTDSINYEDNKADIAVDGNDDGFYSRDDSFFPQDVTTDNFDREYFAEDEGYSEMPSSDFLQNDNDYYYPDEDEY